MIGRTFKCLIGVVALAASRAPAPSADVLFAATECPETGPHRACVMTAVLPPSEYPGCEAHAPYAGGLRTLHVRGKLNARPVQTHSLAVDASGAPPDLAYLGQSPNGRPLILTSKGALEILDPGWDAPASDYYLVDERRWKITTQLLSTNADPIVTTHTDIGVWDEARQLCIASVIEPGRRLRVIEGGCAARPRQLTPAERAEQQREIAKRDFRDGFRAFARLYRALATGDRFMPEGPSPIPTNEPPHHRLGNVEPAETTLSQVRKLLPKEVNNDMGDDDTVATQFGGAGTSIEIVRIKGSKTLLLIAAYDGDGC